MSISRRMPRKFLTNGFEVECLKVKRKRIMVANFSVFYTLVPFSRHLFPNFRHWYYYYYHYKLFKSIFSLFLFQSRILLPMGQQLPVTPTLCSPDKNICFRMLEIDNFYSVSTRRPKNTIGTSISTII